MSEYRTSSAACPICVDSAVRALGAPVSPAIPDPYLAKGQPIPVDPCPLSGPMAGNLSPVVQDKLHTRLRTTARGFTYDLATLLGEGHYEEDLP